MKVVQISPTYFDDSSVVGGGERYPSELSFHMAQSVDTTLVSFSSARRSYRRGNLKVEIYPVKRFLRGQQSNPWSLHFLKSLVGADVIHTHQVSTLISDLGCLAAFLRRKRAFVTDHGGGGSLVLNRRLPLLRCYRKAVAQSRFAQESFPPLLREKAVLIHGGVDLQRFCPDASKRQNKILYVGRLLPHKGVNYLLDGFRLLRRPDYRLVIMGRVYHQQFFEELKSQAQGLPIEFVHDANDERLLHEYRTARATVLPSVHRDCYGNYSPAPELMGFTLLESQACGTPVVCTDAAAMPEFVDEGRTGFVIKQNSAEAIATILNKIMDLPSAEYRQFQGCCREWMQPLDWSVVVQKHLEVYQYPST